MAIVCKVCLASPAVRPDENLAAPFNQEKVLCETCLDARKKLNMRRLVSFILKHDQAMFERRRQDAIRIANEKLVQEKV